MLSRRQVQQMGQARRPIPALIEFEGGLDLVTPPLSLPPGYLRASINYECDVNGGYARIVGYERLDGHPNPSDATAFLLNVTLTGTIAVSNTVTGVTSAATAVVVAVATGYIVVTQVSGVHSGTFVSGEVLNVSASPQATTTSAATSASSPMLAAQYRNLAADAYRAYIAAPTGSGNSLGGFRFNGVSYTFRNNAGGTAANLWKSTSSGWSQVTLFNEISFTAAGVTQPAEGTTLTQGGVTSIIKRVVLLSGTFAGGTAAGRLIISNPAGGNYAGGAATVGAINLTLSAVQTAITLLPSGRYEIIKTNFGGSISTIRIYGCDGVNRGFEFDGTVLVPITTGMTIDAPAHICEHTNHLFFSFAGSAQHSGTGTPYVWSPILGAAELALGDGIVGFREQPGSTTSGTLAIFGRTRISILYGTGVTDWNLVRYREELGAYPYSIQDIGYTVFLDNQGVTNLQTVQAYGNFAHAAVSERIRPWLISERTKTTESCVCRNKNSYRLFFSDGYALFMTVGSGIAALGGAYTKLIGMTQVLFPNPVLWAYSSQESDGTETIIFGSSNGMVYQMEKGTSFDGADINHYFNLAWDNLKSPRTIKHFYDCMLEISGNGYAEFFFGFSLGYGSSNVSQPAVQMETMSFAVSQWDAGIKWDSGAKWDGQVLLPALLEMSGEAENVSIAVRGASDYHAPLKFSGAVIHYSARRELR